MIDPIFQLLFRHEKPLSQSQIYKFLGFKNTEAAFLEMPHDPRFIFQGQDKWSAAPLNTLVEDRPIRETTFVVTDIETTGSIQGADRIIDLAAIKVRNGQEIERFNQLVDPQKHISRHISQLTGISDTDLEGMPQIETIMPQFIEFASDSVFVAHNAPFDFYFIQSEIKRLGLHPLSNPIPVCTFAIAKKLLPTLKACGITGLSTHYDYHVEDRHRAMPDVVATCFFLDKFLVQLKEQGIETLYQLIQYQKESLSKEQVHKRIKRQESKRRQRKLHNRKEP